MLILYCHYVNNNYKKENDGDLERRNFRFGFKYKFDIFRKMGLFLQNVFIYTIACLIILVVVATIYIRYTYGYWRRRKVPYLEPIFPFGNGDSLISKGLFIGALTKKFYDQFRMKGHMAGGKSIWSTRLIS